MIAPFIVVSYDKLGGKQRIFSKPAPPENAGPYTILTQSTIMTYSKTNGKKPSSIILNQLHIVQQFANHVPQSNGWNIAENTNQPIFWKGGY